MTSITIRASAIRPGDVILAEKYGKTYRFDVVGVNRHHDQKPKKVSLTLRNSGAFSEVTIPWDRRHLVERSGGPSGASEALVETTTPSNPVAGSPGAPAGDSRVAALIAQAREEFITKVRKIIRDGYVS